MPLERQFITQTCQVIPKLSLWVMSRTEWEKDITTISIAMALVPVLMMLKDLVQQTLTAESSSPFLELNSTRMQMSGESRIHLFSSSTMVSSSRPQWKLVLDRKPHGMRNSLLITLPERLPQATSWDWKLSMTIPSVMTGSEQPCHFHTANSSIPQTRLCESWNSLTRLAKRLVTSTSQLSTSGLKLHQLT